MEKESHTISPYLVFFLLQSSMIGVGIMNFQRDLTDQGGYSSWISVLLAGIIIHILVWIIYRMLSTDPVNSDLISLNKACFGRIAGNLINGAFVLYFFMVAFSVFRVFVEIVQVWLFPSMSMYPVSIVFLVVIYYTISGGFRTVTGLSFWGIILPYIIVVPLLFFVLKYLHPLNLLPIDVGSIENIWLTIKTMVFQYSGFEVILLIYPLVHTPKKSYKWAQLAVLCSTSIYLVLTLLAFMFFSQGQMKHIIWPTLTMLKTIEIPLIQRLEYIVISIWFLKIIATVSIFLWSACRGLKIAVNIKHRTSSLIFLAGFLTMQILFFKDRSSISILSMVVSNIGFYFIYVYIPILFVIVLLRSKFMSRKLNDGKK
ncbi:GerAB/ArcD/ProY family transporter [Paenibacillus sp. V4I7]|uniref:GerAB/ArcD/ProY family transporter n=1 Tax=Paenibacillus sp. V4I7 TaxID=3042307 RepID=UPI00278053BE|nr:GerAB/ArcD/ProY family transporter [Paenibacillus sp. V4I7]MDQ0898012.1 spore germination protein (amino acid permease) [Paenibacillus sp. V4I7]MDQ0915985.1 spore germination protein (amino acid permease) [Paenibacillus sp. V4I5]